MLSENVENAVKRNAKRLWLTESTKGSKYTYDDIIQGLERAAEDFLTQYPENTVIEKLSEATLYDAEFCLMML